MESQGGRMVCSEQPRVGLEPGAAAVRSALAWCALCRVKRRDAPLVTWWCSLLPLELCFQRICLSVVLWMFAAGASNWRFSERACVLCVGLCVCAAECWSPTATSVKTEMLSFFMLSNLVSVCLSVCSVLLLVFLNVPLLFLVELFFSN